MNINILAYAKTNLSLEIISKREDGYHNIHSIMHSVDLYDELNISVETLDNQLTALTGNLITIDMESATDEVINTKENLAYRAACHFLEDVNDKAAIYKIHICINKHIPLAAGLAGGSADAAAVLLGLNALLGFPLSLDELLDIGLNIGSDIPFSILMNAYRNRDILSGLRGIDRTSLSALVTGIGDGIKPMNPSNWTMIISNPGVKVSTADTYKRLDEAGLAYEPCYDLFFNRLEHITFDASPATRSLYQFLQENSHADYILMSGSGPSIVAYYSDDELASSDFLDFQSKQMGTWNFWLSRLGG